MNYSSVVTSKGTITIPAAIRKKNAMNEGERVEITQTPAGIIEIKRMPNLDELRARNKAHLIKNSMWPAKVHPNDHGIELYIKEKYGKR